MKRIRYIRPTKRRPEAHQRAATDHLEPFAITIVHGEQDRTFKNALKILKAGNALTIQDLHTLARRRDTICDMVSQIFAKGAFIETADGSLHKPACEASLIAGIMTGGCLTVEQRERIVHNRIDDEKRALAFKYWQDHSLSNEAVARLAEIQYQTMRKWWQKDFPRPLEKPGRKPKTEE
jgi:hypothetical protein